MAKKAWNMSNPLYRYLHSKGKIKHASKRGGLKQMAKKTYRRRGSFGGMGGLLKPLMAAGVGYAISKFTRNRLFGAIAGAGTGLALGAGSKTIIAGAGAGYLQPNIDSVLAGQGVGSLF